MNKPRVLKVLGKEEIAFKK